MTLYNATPDPVDARLNIGLDYAAAERIDFLGDPFRESSLSIDGDSLTVPFGPFEVVCLRILD